MKEQKILMGYELAHGPSAQPTYPSHIEDVQYDYTLLYSNITCAVSSLFGPLHLRTSFATSSNIISLLLIVGSMFAETNCQSGLVSFRVIVVG